MESSVILWLASGDYAMSFVIEAQRLSDPTNFYNTLSTWLAHYRANPPNGKRLQNTDPVFVSVKNDQGTEHFVFRPEISDWVLCGGWSEAQRKCKGLMGLVNVVA